MNFGPREVYYNQNAAVTRVGELLGKGKNVWIRRDIDNGSSVWVVEYK